MKPDLKETLINEHLDFTLGRLGEVASCSEECEHKSNRVFVILGNSLVAWSSSKGLFFFILHPLLGRKYSINDTSICTNIINDKFEEFIKRGNNHD